MLDVPGQSEGKLLSSDLATRAARKLFAANDIDPRDVDYIILCTQTPDFALPTTACLVHGQLDMRTDVGALDVTHGGSGYVYALGLAAALIETSQVRNVLVLTAETSRRHESVGNDVIRNFVEGAATATLVADDASGTKRLSSFSLGTDGSAGSELFAPAGGFQPGVTNPVGDSADDSRRGSNDPYPLSHGADLLDHTLRVVSQCVTDVLKHAGLDLEDVNLFVFHQADGYLIEHLRKKLGVASERFVVALEDYGNTGSSTIPIALADAIEAGRVREGDRVMLVGFGVGLSWGGVIATW